MRLQAFLVNNLEKVAGVEPHAHQDPETVRGGEFAEDRVHQCGVEGMAIFWVVVVGRKKGWAWFFTLFELLRF